jgi:hypothetical protein
MPDVNRLNEIFKSGYNHGIDVGCGTMFNLVKDYLNAEFLHEEETRLINYHSEQLIGQCLADKY